MTKRRTVSIRKPRALTKYEQACKKQEELENEIDKLESILANATDEDTIDETSRELEYKREELDQIEQFIYDEEIAGLNRDYIRSILPL